MRRELLAILLLSSTACVPGPAASTAPSSARPPGHAAPSLSSNSSVITAAELRRASASDLYDAIVQLRPTFFATRGPASLLNEPAHPIVVIIDGQVIGGTSALDGLPTAITKSVWRLTAAEVFQRTGVSAPSGGIEVILGRDG